MQNHVWVALLRHIPPERQSQYMLVTKAGTEIAIQSFLRIEEELAVFKGRLSGTQETGRIFFIPYDSLDYFGSQQPVQDVEFNEAFEALVLPSSPVVALPSVPEYSDPPPGRADPSPRQTIRSEVLERFRSRPSSSTTLPDPRANGS